MENFRCLTDHFEVMQLRETVLVDKTLQEKFIDIVIFTASRSLVIEVPWHTRLLPLHVDFFLALRTILILLQKRPIIRAVLDTFLPWCWTSIHFKLNY